MKLKPKLELTLRGDLGTDDLTLSVCVFFDRTDALIPFNWSQPPKHHIFVKLLVFKLSCLKKVKNITENLLCLTFGGGEYLFFFPPLIAEHKNIILALNSA